MWGVGVPGDADLQQCFYSKRGTSRGAWQNTILVARYLDSYDPGEIMLASFFMIGHECCITSWHGRKPHRSSFHSGFMERRPHSSVPNSAWTFDHLDRKPQCLCYYLWEARLLNLPMYSNQWQECLWTVTRVREFNGGCKENVLVAQYWLAGMFWRNAE